MRRRLEIVKYPKFSEVDFIRLYCAMNFRYGCKPIIKHHDLEKRLYDFYSLSEFKELFEDIIPKKDYINPKNSYLDLEYALQTVQLFGLLTPIDSVGEIRSIISLDDDMAQEIIENIDANIVDKMSKLFCAIFELDNNSKKIENTDISNAETVIIQKAQGPKLVKRNGNKKN